MNTVPGYHELVEKQARARLVDDLKKLAQANPAEHQTVLDLVSSYAQDPNNREFLDQVTDMNFIQERALEKAAQQSPEKITQAVAGLPDAQKAKHLAEVAAGTSDEEFERFVAAERARRAGQQPPPS
ncbi:MAG TPA: hypothetical protein VGE74_08645 [Gemmata sp.]